MDLWKTYISLPEKNYKELCFINKFFKNICLFMNRLCYINKRKNLEIFFKLLKKCIIIKYQMEVSEEERVNFENH